MAIGLGLRVGQQVEAEYSRGEWYPALILDIYRHGGPENDTRFKNDHRIRVIYTEDGLIESVADDEVRVPVVTQA